MGELRGITWTPAQKAGENLNTDALIYRPIALDDGKLANNGAEAAGILQNKVLTGDHMTLLVQGISEFRAGGAVAAHGPMTVSTSGWCTAAASGDHQIGSALEAVTSGSIGVGLFDFAKEYYQVSSL